MSYQSKNRGLQIFYTNYSFLKFFYFHSSGLGGLPYKSDWDACSKIKTIPLRETNVGVAEAYPDC